MASGFYVNVEHVRHFEQQVHRNTAYATEADRVMDLPSMRDELVGSGGAAGMSAHGWIVPSIKKWLDRAAQDNESIRTALSTSARSLHHSAQYYESMDRDRAAALDRLYKAPEFGEALTTGPVPAGTRFSFPGTGPIHEKDVRHDPHLRPWDREQPEDYTTKDYHWVNLRPLQELDPKTNPQAVFGENWVLSVEKAAKNVDGLLPLPSVSPVSWALTTICGEDVVEKIAQLITGDWLAVEKVTRALHWHGQVQRDLHDNLLRGLFAMQGMWTGTAGSRMQDSMQRLVRNGIAPHSQFLWEIRDRITNYAKATYHTFKMAEAFINMAISHLEPVAFLKRVDKIVDGLTKAALSVIKGEWSKVTGQVENLRIAAHAVGAAVAHHSALSGGPSGSYVPDGFVHPADTNRDGKLSAGEKRGRS